jgi:hypothetical protein
MRGLLAGLVLALSQSTFVHILDTGSVNGASWYVNDHTLVRGDDGVWHLFGIYHTDPFGSEDENQFVHATHAPAAPSALTEGSFKVEKDPALRKAGGETHLWAPHVVKDGVRWVMVYQAGGPENNRAQIRLAESRDLTHWNRVGTLFEDVCVARDPMLFKTADRWILYYTRCDSTWTKHSGVAYRTSTDLSNWSEPSMALILGGTPPMFNSGYTESPFVFEKDGWYYLSVTSYPVAWDATFLFRSRSPYSFSAPPVARLQAHAAEWIVEGGDLYMTHCGAGQKGVWLSRISGL